jgi:hypothetical protein
MTASSGGGFLIAVKACTVTPRLDLLGRGHAL